MRYISISITARKRYGKTTGEDFGRRTRNRLRNQGEESRARPRAGRQAELAEKAGISKRCLCSLELGQSHGVQLDKLTAVLGTLGLDLVISPASGTELSASSAVSTRPLNQPAAYSARVEDGSIDVLVMLTGTPRR